VAAAGFLNQDEADVVIAEAAEGFEPLHAVYRRETCIPAIESAIDADQWRMISWFPRVKLRRLTPDELRHYDPQGLAFWNVNTPDEFSQAEQRAGS
jgi:molybdopterin-guanine dinucleotide biosynthesis protein A